MNAASILSWRTGWTLADPVIAVVSSTSVGVAICCRPLVLDDLEEVEMVVFVDGGEFVQLKLVLDSNEEEMIVERSVDQRCGIESIIIASNAWIL